MKVRIDRERVERAFTEYAGHYDAEDVKIRLKIDHTYRVAAIAERIARSLTNDPERVDFAWLSGMLHDIGRFEQLRRYGTFIDRLSVDHAELGADLLFVDGLIGDFAEMQAESAERAMMETAIRQHNKLALPEDLDEDTAMYANILRDADKCDIFRVLTEPPFDERNGRITAETRPARDSVMCCVLEHRCVPRGEDLTAFEGLLAQCCMAFELFYPESRRIAEEQGYLDMLLHLSLQPGPREQMEILRRELGRPDGDRLSERA